MLQFSLYQSHPGSSFVGASFDNEPEPRAGLLTGLIFDMYDQEDLYLNEITKAEAGETILDLYNNLVALELYPEGRVIIRDLRYSEEDEAERGPPAYAEFTVAEIKQLILDWLAAKKEWRERRTVNEAEAPPAKSTQV